MWILLLALLVPELVLAGTISRPAKSNLQSSFTNGMTPTAADLNGDPDTIYNEFNGNISNANISASAAIAASKLNPDGFTVNVRTVNAAPCTVLDESDQAADSKRWAACLISGTFSLSTYTDANTLQNTWFSINRSNGSFSLGGASGTNTIQGPTTFTGTVSFSAGNTLLPTGTIAAYISNTPPAGWLLMDNSVNSCQGASNANAALCALLVALYPGANFKGSPNGTITVDTTTDEIIRTAHGVPVNDRVHFTTSGTLPAPLSASTVYCVISVTTDRYKISTTCGGAAIDITNTGSGTHSDYDKFLTPDSLGRAIVGAGQGSGLTLRSIGQKGGEESHILTTNEMPSHNHKILVNPSTAGGGGGITGVNGSLDIGKFTENTGGGAAHNVMDPFIVFRYIIKL